MPKHSLNRDSDHLFLDKELHYLQQTGLLRKLKTISKRNGAIVLINGKKYISFASNDYLGVANRWNIKRLKETFKNYGAGASASRLISGNFEIHEKLEEKLASWMKTESAIVFPTGYMANIGVITSLMNEKDAIFSDEFNHSSIIDACRLSKAKIFVYPHRNVNKLEELLKKAKHFKKRLIATETVFSMDGDFTPLKEIVSLAKKYDAITMLDEAHALGVFGKTGRGLAEHFGLNARVDIVMGTLSKAFGSQGGVVFGSRQLIEFLINRARTFIYTTALSPILCEKALESLEIIKKENSSKEKLWKLTNYFHNELNNLGINKLDPCSHIVPIFIGETKKVAPFVNALFNKKLFVAGIRPPTVPAGKSRLRISLTANHSFAQLDVLLDALSHINV